MLDAAGELWARRQSLGILVMLTFTAVMNARDGRKRCFCCYERPALKSCCDSSAAGDDGGRKQPKLRTTLALCVRALSPSSAGVRHREVAPQALGCLPNPRANHQREMTRQWLIEV
jgi:hypothetical protein